ncbi:MAG: L,D-transpeptidase [Caulobacteraceae bacterium]|nr:L,D-transpeptidase [Caulobacteraceae bacterium]
MRRRAVIGAAMGAALGLTAGTAEAGRLTVPPGAYPSGAVVISQSARKLYLVLGRKEAIAYPVAVAKPGMEWSGLARVAEKFVEPAWSPPDSVRRDHPGLPGVIPGGAPSNPMGARAITLDRAEIAIHGTTRAMRASIGTAASYGCIRMRNEDVIDLFDRVAVGAPVVMTP